jgi:hypothetical protein
VTLLVAIVAPLRLRARSAAWLLAYVAACAILLGTAAALLERHRHDLVDLLAAYLLPESWRFAARTLVERFLHAQGRQVLVNASVGASLTALSLLFPIKERLSASFERDARLTREPGRGLPLWLQALEEGWLALVFATAQMTIFWIGYPPHPWRKQLALALSWATLFASTGVSFLSPLWQRHRMRYATILKALLMRPFTLFGFGALFALPPVAAGHFALAHAWPFPRALLLVAATTVASVAWATLGGTAAAARLFDAARATRAPHLLTRATANLALLALAGANVWLFGAVALSLHHKSQILKCHYRVVPSSLQVDLPELSTVLANDVHVTLRLDLEIENPTAFDVEIEQNRLELRFEGVPVAFTTVTPLAVPAHLSRTAHVELPLAVNLSVLRRGRALLDRDRWSATLYLRVTPDLEFPFYLLTAQEKVTPPASP